MSITLILCAIIFGISLWGFNSPALFHNLMHFPYQEARDKSYYRLFTSIFLHGSWLHLLVNLFVFYTFGEAIEYQFGHLFGPVLGKINFILLFVLSGVLADVFTYRKYSDNPNFRSVGASGSISGIMFAYVLFYPLEYLYLYGIIPIPGIIAAVLYLWYSNYASKKEGGRIDHNAHFFGAVTGLVFTIIVYPPVVSHFINELLSVLG
ncbi:rhomboid family intramembrane serine protease [Membranicola marinus]|uniref:Rhomboid family intramembrane serine protease n=1 Tax=Membranihabitans marinus TaxID=1227546 RepID=A0A953LDM9_9BACT|nr:rhomboid family intramembrane serine protease [Membranihabitans marinus]MBY5959039.1 rhomboid family intramembrane serine protease [Membranihabitans marinus]